MAITEKALDTKCVRKNHALCPKNVTSNTKHSKFALKTTVKERICAVCRTPKPTKSLIRIARIESKYLIDERGNANGRGCRICSTCVEKAIKTRALNKSFKAKLPDDIYELLADFGKRETAVPPAQDNTKHTQ